MAAVYHSNHHFHSAWEGMSSFYQQSSTVLSSCEPTPQTYYPAEYFSVATPDYHEAEPSAYHSYATPYTYPLDIPTSSTPLEYPSPDPDSPLQSLHFEHDSSVYFAHESFEFAHQPHYHEEPSHHYDEAPRYEQEIPDSASPAHLSPPLPSPPYSAPPSPEEAVEAAVEPEPEEPKVVKAVKATKKRKVAGAVKKASVGTPFIAKLVELLTKDEYKSVIRWSDKGDTILYSHEDPELLDAFSVVFRHTKIESFIRQLNAYS
ncbi:heat shock transcription factor [Pseudohyphozyma bogoriensis]|nr:heat shock transcription factor [Pseudohyphozyma bogoriensis]